MQRLVLGMKDVNTSIEDLAFNLFADLSSEVLSRRFEERTVEFLRATGARGAVRMVEQGAGKEGRCRSTFSRSCSPSSSNTSTTPS
mgnify:FL=1